MSTYFPFIFLAVLAWQSSTKRQEIVTPTVTFAALWIAGFAALSARSEGAAHPAAVALPLGSAVLLFLGEQSVRLPCARTTPRRGRTAAGAYWAFAALAIAGAAMKFSASLAHMGDITSMFSSTALRGAVTSSEVFFSPVATALNSAMYVAAALTGYLCQDRLRLRYFTHFVAAILDSAALAGRGSFIIAGIITLIGLAVAYRGPFSRGRARFAMATLAGGGAIIALSVGIGRHDFVSNMWKYICGPIYGLSQFWTVRPPAGIEGVALFNALLSKFGAERYDAGAFVWYIPFKANVHSGFRELVTDFGVVSVVCFAAVGAFAARQHVHFREVGSWSPYAITVSLYSFLAYFYYVPLSAFLTGWWGILLSACAAWVPSIIRTRGQQRTALAASDGAPLGAR